AEMQRPLIAALLGLAIAAAAGSGRAGTSSFLRSTNGAGDLASATASASAISAGVASSCALTGLGGVRCWGGNDGVPVYVRGLGAGVTAIAAGSAGFDSCA